MFTDDFFTMFIHFAPTPPKKQPTPWPFETAEPWISRWMKSWSILDPTRTSLVWSRRNLKKPDPFLDSFINYGIAWMSQEIRINGQ